MKTISQIKTEKRHRNHRKLRSKISGTGESPRLAVFKSNTAVYAQLIDDEKGVTVAQATSKGMKGKGQLEKSKEIGKSLAEKALALGVKKVVFDRGGFQYTGKIAAVAEGAREGGLKF